MHNIIINTKKHTIEINKTFAKAASLFGSDEYNALQAARRDNPSFKVVTVSKKTTKTEFKGLTYDYMEKDNHKSNQKVRFLMNKKMNDYPILNLPTSYTGFDEQDYFSELLCGRGTKPIPIDYRCCICGKPFLGYGNKPAPLTNDVRMRCCNRCNIEHVMPARARSRLIY